MIVVSSGRPPCKTKLAKAASPLLAALDVEGIFRRSADVTTVRQLQRRYNEGESVDFKDLGDPHLAAVMLKTFLRELTEPIMTFELYEEVLKIHGA